MKNGARFLALAAVVLLPLTAAGTQADWTAANRALVDGYVIPRYAALALATARLAEEADTFCRTPDAESLEKARDGFHGVMDAWQAVGHLSFGPVELYMRRYRFELWPDKHNTAAKQLRTLLAAENREILTEGAFARASVAIQGLPALESLLFEEGVDASAFGSGRESSYRCELMQAIAGNLAAMATEVLEAWTSGTPPVREQVLTAAEGNGHFASGAEVSVLFLRDLRTSLQTVADLKLARPLGEDAPAAKPRRAESWLSGRSLRNIRIDLEAARDLYLTGYAPLLAAIPQTTVLDERIRAAFSEALAADALEASLADQVADPARRPGIGRLLASVRTLEQLVAQELPEALGLTIGFNALDGD